MVFCVRFSFFGGDANNIRKHRRPNVQSLDWEDLLEVVMTIHSSILPGETPGQRSLAGYTVHGVTKSQTWLSDSHTHTQGEINCCSALRDWTSKAQLKDKEGLEPTPPIPILSQTRGTHPAAKRLITSHSLIKLIHYNPPQGWTFNYATISVTPFIIFPQKVSFWNAS